MRNMALSSTLPEKRRIMRASLSCPQRNFSHPINNLMALKVPSCSEGTTVTRAHLPLHSLSGALMRREDLLKPDGMSEAIVLGAGVVVFVILILILIIILTHAAVPV